ncbi:MAG: hypothetical protein WC370_02955 [Dehalococcoidales bacterium]|jgi:hypothetical protein
MAKNKYDKNFSAEVVKEVEGKSGAFVTSTRHLADKFGGGHLSIDCIYVNAPHQMISQPHKHEFPQYLNFYSANPKDPRDFDAVIEMTVGETAEKGEVHIIDKPTSVYVAAGLYHGPLIFKTVNKPVLFIDIAVTGKYSRVGNTPD